MPAGNTDYRARAAIAAGGGAYTRKIVLPVANRAAGHSAEFLVALPASVNPTVEIRDADASGTVLFTMTGDAAVARNFAVRAVFTELAAWEVFDAREIL